MKPNIERRNQFSSLPYYKSNPINFTVGSTSVNEEITITLVTDTGDSDPGTFCFAAQSLDFSNMSHSRIVDGMGTTGSGLDASMILIDSQTIQVHYPSKLPSPSSLVFGLYLWWSNGVTDFGVSPSTNMPKGSSVSFYGKRQDLANGNVVFFDLP
jgi:hypothetical protein